MEKFAFILIRITDFPYKKHSLGCYAVIIFIRDLNDRDFLETRSVSCQLLQNLGKIIIGKKQNILKLFQFPCATTQGNRR